MKTDWETIRKLMNSAIDACETVDRLGVSEENRSEVFMENGQHSSEMWDYLQSAYTYPENLAYAVIRARHDLKDDKPYTTEVGRVLINIGRLCAELVDAKDTKKKVPNTYPNSPDTEQSLEEMVLGLCSWYRDWMIPGVTKIINQNV